MVQPDQSDCQGRVDREVFQAEGALPVPDIYLLRLINKKTQNQKMKQTTHNKFIFLIFS
jgi:hypothetical protein